MSQPVALPSADLLPPGRDDEFPIRDAIRRVAEIEEDFPPLVPARGSNRLDAMLELERHAKFLAKACHRLMRERDELARRVAELEAGSEVARG